MKLRTIIISVCISFLALLILAIVLSVFWPSSWNELLGSTLLNIVAGLIVLTLEIIVAIFIVEKYLENQRRKKEALDTLVEQIRKTKCIAVTQGILGVNVEGIIHLTFYTLYGLEKWNIPLVSHKDGIIITPKNMLEFISLIMSTFKDNPELSEQSLVIIKNEFKEKPKINLTISQKEVVFFIDFVNMTINRIQDLLFLFQPFVEDRFDFLKNLLDFSQTLKDSALKNVFVPVTVQEYEQHESVFHLSEKGEMTMKSLGIEALKLYESIKGFYKT
jgi:hypothetical protein